MNLCPHGKMLGWKCELCMEKTEMEKAFFDVECSRLANHFLDDFENASYAERQDLAVTIQRAVEDWFMAHDKLKEKR